MRFLDVLAAVLLVIGGLNWGLYGLFDIDLVASTTGAAPALARSVYAAVSFAALYQIFGLRAIQRRWNVAEARVN